MNGTLQQKAEQTATQPTPVKTPSAGSPLAGGPFVEKRREVRYGTCEPVEVCILEMASCEKASGEMASCRLAGVLRDVSRNGLRIELSMPVNAGARLEIVLRDRAIIFGEARYCSGSGGAYQVGVVIEDVYYPKPVLATDLRDEDRGPGYLQGYWYPMTTRFLNGHASRNDVQSFPCHHIPETKTALAG
jgi:hypothetical protein